MKILLRRDIPDVGLAGEVVEVKNGYARNYLIPQRLGLLPTQANIKAIEEDKRRAEEERRVRRAALEDRAARLHNVEITISVACNADGHLYGSVGPREIAAALREEGHDVEAKQVHLSEPIRHLDTVTVPVVFAEDLRVDVKVWVVRAAASADLDEQPAEEARPQERREADRYAYGPGSQIDALETDL